QNAPGVLVIESSKYIGYLSAREMIEVIHERNLIRARDENPLTRLPGNFMINEYIADTFEMKYDAVLCYFDFDHFKPYNDYYGFRNGDRVILLFADLMRKSLSQEYFKGHIGGDDFFVGIVLDETNTFESVCGDVEVLVRKFGDDVREFYDAKDRERECIVTEDRFGEKREFKLLSVSAVVAHVGATTTIGSAEQLNQLFAIEKKHAKHAANHIAIINI
ncbi:MAG: diguanylate cyclase domain-containing protein, partial [Sulfuricurvum sp.]